MLRMRWRAVTLSMMAGSDAAHKMAGGDAAHEWAGSDAAHEMRKTAGDDAGSVQPTVRPFRGSVRESVCLCFRPSCAQRRQLNGAHADTKDTKFCHCL